ncbi:MAG: colanic acid biosynthesis glycosyltransferase WcaL, partial [Gammaproteobacteria bacterium]
MTARVAYILKGYPRLSETFITNEIFVLEQLGLDLGLFVIKRAQEHVAQDTVARIVAPVHYLPRATSLSATGLLRWLGDNLPAYLRGNLNCLVRHPLRYPATLARAIVMGWRYRKPDGAYRKVYIKEFLQAAHIAAAVEAAGGYRQLHAHFCHGATTVAMLASRLTGLPYSFTAHAKDIYQAEQNPGDLLRVKVDGARFVATCTASNRAHLDRIAGRGSIHKIYHGLDVTRFHPADRRCNRGQGPVRILAVGRYVEK